MLKQDRLTSESKGYAFFAYKDSSSIFRACEGLNNRDIHGKIISCKPAKNAGIFETDSLTSVIHAQVDSSRGPIGSGTGLRLGGASQQLLQMRMRGAVGDKDAGLARVSAPVMKSGTTMSTPVLKQPSRVICLYNMVVASELSDPAEYQDIYADVMEECSKFGGVTKLLIPRPTGRKQQDVDVGKIYVEYDTTQSAMNAIQVLHGRTFAGRAVICMYINLQQWELAKDVHSS
jgi:hypothetical protein